MGGGEGGGFQHPQQFGLVALEAVQDLIERFAGGFRGAQRLEAGGDPVFGRRVGMPAAGLQVPIQEPDLLPHPGDGAPVRLIQGHQVRQGPLGMDPAQAVHEQVQLAGIVADQTDVEVEALRGQTADQGPFGGRRPGPVGPCRLAPRR